MFMCDLSDYACNVLGFLRSKFPYTSTGGSTVFERYLNDKDERVFVVLTGRRENKIQM